MVELERILIVIDDDADTDSALEAGLSLATRASAEVVVLGVIAHPDRWTRSLRGIIDPKELLTGMAEELTSRIQDRVDRLNHTSTVRVEVVTGTPFIEIIRRAVSLRADLVVQGSHSDDSPGSFGSSDWHLMRKSPMPVWIVQPDASAIPSRIGVTFDPLQTDDEQNMFNKQILSLAGTLATHFGSELLMYSAWDFYGESQLRHSAFLKVSKAEIDDLLAQAEDAALQAQDSIRFWFESVYPDLQPTAVWQLEKGQASELISSFAQRSELELLVMGTLGRSGIPGFLIGNTAESVLGKIRCSALTLKPSLFQSPVV